jgi:uncharacterized protein
MELKRLTQVFLTLILMMSVPVYADDLQDGLDALRREDHKAAFKEFKPLAKSGNVHAQYHLAKMYYQGKGAKKNYKEAFKLFKIVADKGYAEAQYKLGEMYQMGLGVPKNIQKAVKWYKLLASQDYVDVQVKLAEMYEKGIDVKQNLRESFKWYLILAEKGYADAQFKVGAMYENGKGVPRDGGKALKLYEKAAKKDFGEAQAKLGRWYFEGEVVPKDFVISHVFLSLSMVNGFLKEADLKNSLESIMSAKQIEKSIKLASNWKSGRKFSLTEASVSKNKKPIDSKSLKIASRGTGFFINKNGHVLTNYHVIEDCQEIKTPNGTLLQEVAHDERNDLALLKGSPVSKAAEFRLGRLVLNERVAAAGYPLPGILSSGLKITPGTLNALAGFQNDTRYVQINTPIQPGNSGGPLLDQSGYVIGVITAKLNALLTARATGDIPQNVNFALRDSVAKAFLDANGVRYSESPPLPPVDGPALAQMAQQFTIALVCRK